MLTCLIWLGSWAGTGSSTKCCMNLQVLVEEKKKMGGISCASPAPSIVKFTRLLEPCRWNVMGLPVSIVRTIRRKNTMILRGGITLVLIIFFCKSMVSSHVYGMNVYNHPSVTVQCCEVMSYSFSSRVPWLLVLLKERWLSTINLYKWFDQIQIIAGLIKKCMKFKMN